MSDIFEVGQIYENENGRFRVLGIKAADIEIEYLTGGKKITRLVIQERIQERMQAEEELAQKEEEKASRRKSKKVKKSKK